MLEYTAADGTRRVKMTAEEKEAAGLRPSAATLGREKAIAELAAKDQARAEAQAVAPKRERPGNWVDSAIAGAMGDTSHTDSGLARGAANMAGNLARDAAIISAIAVVAIYMLRFLTRILHERTGLTVTDSVKKLGGFWAQFLRDE